MVCNSVSNSKLKIFKFLVCSLFLCLLVSSVSAGQYSSSQTAIAQTAGWHFDEASGNVADYGGLGFTGTASNLVYNRQGVIGTAVYFNGKNAFINNTNILATLITQPVGTISIWYKRSGAMTAGSTTHTLFWCNNNNKDYFGGYMIQNVSAGVGRVIAYNRPTTENWQGYIDVPGLLDGKFHNVVLRQNGYMPDMFVDGVLYPMTWSTTTNRVTWFSSIPSVTECYTGLNEGFTAQVKTYSNETLDELRIYSRALSDMEIAELAALRNPVAIYRMNDVSGAVLDSSGHGYNGVANSKVTRNVNGVFNTGYSFDPKTGGYINITNAKAFAYRNFSFVGWIKAGVPKPSDSQEVIVNMKNNSGGATSMWLIRINNDTGYLNTYLRNETGSVCANLVGNKVVTDNRWHQVVVTVNQSANITIYLDGVSHASVALPSGCYGMKTASFMTIGSSIDPPTYIFNGSMDDFAFVARALTSKDVSVLYNGSMKFPRMSLTYPTPSNLSVIECDVDGYCRFAVNATINSTTNSNVNYAVVFNNTNFTLTSSLAVYDAMERIYGGGSDNWDMEFFPGKNAPTVVKGVRGNALNFNGRAHGLNSTSIIPSAYGYSARTVSVWFRLNDVNRKAFQYPIINWGDQVAGRMFAVSTVRNRTFVWGWSLDMEVTNTTLATNTWYNVIVTNDGSQTILYLNGVKQLTRAATTYYTGRTLVEIGGNCRGGGGGNCGYFNGSIDDVRVYTSAFTPALVTALYNEQRGFTPEAVSLSGAFPGSSQIVTTKVGPINYGTGKKNYTFQIAARDSNWNNDTKTYTVQVNKNPYFVQMDSSIINGTKSYCNSTACVFKSLGIINASSLSDVVASVDNSNLTLYGNNLVLDIEFNNYSAIGDSATLMYDQSRHRNNGTTTIGVKSLTPIYAVGKYGLGLNLIRDLSEGVNITLDNELKPATNFAMFAWVKFNRLATQGAGYSEDIINAINTSYTTGYGLRQENNGGVDKIDCHINSQSAFTTALPTSFVGQWHQFGCVYNSTHIITYVDGVKNTTTPYTTAISYNQVQSLLLGRWRVRQFNGDFNGTLDSVMIWNRSLTDDSISKLYLSNIYKYRTSAWGVVNSRLVGVDSGKTNNYTVKLFANDVVKGWNGTRAYIFPVTNLAEVSSITGSNPADGSTIDCYQSGSCRYSFNATLNVREPKEVKVQINSVNYTLIDNNTVLYYGFDNNMAINHNFDEPDLSRKNNTGKYTGEFYADSGVTGKSLYCDGLGRKIATNSSSTLNNFRNITVAVWTKFNNLRYDANIIVEKGNEQLGYQYRTFGLYVYGNGGTLSFDSYPGTSTAVFNAAYKNIWEDGKWHYIVGTANNTKASLYVDGVLVNTTTRSGVMYASSNGVYVCAASDSRWSYIGNVDNLLISRRYYGPDEIKQLYQNDLYRYNNTVWMLLSNQNSASGTKSYKVHVVDSDGNGASSGLYSVTHNVVAPTISFIPPTNTSGRYSKKYNFTVNVSIDGSSLSSVNVTIGNSSSYNSGKYINVSLDNNLVLLMDNERASFSNNRSIQMKNIPGLVGYWRMDEASSALTDSSGNGNSCTAVGNMSYARDGRINRSIYFDGVGDYFTCGTGATLQLKRTGTISIWAKLKPFVLSTSNGQCILCKSAYGDWNQGGYSIWVHGGTGTVFGGISNNSANNNYTMSHIGIPEFNKWYLYTVTWDGYRVITYFNGKVVTNVTQRHNAHYSTNWDFRFGTNPSANQNIVGDLDEALVANRAFTPREVTNLYEEGRFKDGSLINRTLYANGFNSTSDGKSGKDIDFNGRSTYVYSNDIRGLVSQTGTACAWVKMTGYPINGYPIFVSMGSETDDTRHFAPLRVWSNGRFGLIQVNADTNDVITVNGPRPSANIWYHICSSSTGSVYKFYVNGVSQPLNVTAGANTGDWSGDVTGLSNVVVGSLVRTSQLILGYTNGSIDDVRIWNRTLSDADILGVYNSRIQRSNDSRTIMSMSLLNSPININNTYTVAADAVLGSSSGPVWFEYDPVAAVHLVPPTTNSGNVSNRLIRINATSVLGVGRTFKNLSVFVFKSGVLYNRTYTLSNVPFYTVYNTLPLGNYTFNATVCGTDDQCTLSTEYRNIWMRKSPSMSVIYPSNLTYFPTNLMLVNVTTGQNVSSCYMSVRGNLTVYDLGDGVQGDLNVTAANTIVNTYAYLSNTTPAGKVNVYVSSVSGLSAGNEILITQSQNYVGGTVGRYEFRRIASVGANYITLRNPLNYSFYAGNRNTTAASTLTQIIMVPNYNNLYVSSGASIVPQVWRSTTGGGIVVFKVRGNLIVNGFINATSRGFRVGWCADGGAVESTDGESYQGTDNSCASGTVAPNLGGGGAGRGTNADPPDTAGGGGGHAAAGQTARDNTSSATYWGQGGNAYGWVNATLLELGSGGGQGASAGTALYNPDHGGGVVFIKAGNIFVSNTGRIQAAGGPTNVRVVTNHPYGAGSGGSIILSAPVMNIGTNRVTVAGGLYDYNSPEYGGMGGVGRVRLEYSSLSGSPVQAPVKANITSMYGGSTGGSRKANITGAITNNGVNTYVTFRATANEGNQTFFANCTSATGFTNVTKSYLIYSDLNYPVIVMVKPQSAVGGTKNSWIVINTTTTDTYLKNTTLWLYNKTSGVLLQKWYSGVPSTEYNFTGLKSSTFYVYNVTSFDLSGKKTSYPSRDLVVDTTWPMVSFIAPTLANLTKINVTTYVFNATIDERYLGGVNMSFNGSKGTHKIVYYNRTLVLDEGFDNNAGIGDSSSIAVDISMWRNNGSIVGPVYTAAGKYSNALSFDGRNDYVKFGNSSSVSLGRNGKSFTLEAWVKPIQQTPSKYGFIVGRDSLAGRNVWFGQNASTPANLLFIVTNTSGTGLSTFTNANSLDINVWQHVVVVYDRSTNSVKIYKNGAKLALKSSTFPATLYDALYSKGNFSVGDTPDRTAGTYPFNGTIDEVRVWQRALSPQEVNASYYTNLRKFNATKYYIEVRTPVYVSEYNYDTEVFDTSGGVNTTRMYYIYSDNIKPVVSYNVPSYASGFNSSSSIVMNVSGTDVNNISSMRLYMINDSGSILKQINATGGQNIGVLNISNAFSGLADAIYKFNATANDTFANRNVSLTRFITVDTKLPVNVFLSPRSGKNNVSAQIFNISVVERNLRNATFAIRNNTKQFNYSYYDDSLILDWQFDQNAALGEAGTLLVDVSKSKKNLTSAVTTFSSGKYGNAGKFGLNSGGNINGLNVNKSAGGYNTLEFWFNWQGKVPSEVPGVFSDSGGGTYAMYASSATCMGILDNAIGNWGFNPTGLANSWHHAAVVLYNGRIQTGSKIYIDGVQQTLTLCSGSGTMSNRNLTGNFRLSSTEATEPMNGSIDELRIWNRQLTLSEIQEHVKGNLKKTNRTQWYLRRTETLPNSAYTFQIKSGDLAKSVNTTSLYARFDSSVPTFTFNPSSMPAGYNRTSIYVNVSSIDPNNITFMRVILTNDSGAILSVRNITGGIGITKLNYSGTFYGLSNMTYKVNVTANDTLNNLGSSRRFITIDTANPVVVTILPTYGNKTVQSQTFNMSIYEKGGLRNLTLGIKNNTKYANTTYYSDNLVLMVNYDNIASLGEGLALTFDSSRYNNNGTMTGMVYRPGKYGNDIKFGSGIITNDMHLNVPMNTTAGAKNTIEGWMYMGPSMQGRFIESGYLLYGVQTQTCWGFLPSGGGGILGFNPTSYMNGWHHFAAVLYNGYPSRSQNKIYIDGVLQTLSYCTSYTNLSTSAGNYVRIGTPFNSDAFNGSVDEIRAWNRELTQSEIQEHYLGNLQRYNKTQWYLRRTQNMPVSTYNLKTYAGDLAKNTNASSQFIRVDYTAPIVTFVSWRLSGTWFDPSWNYAKEFNVTDMSGSGLSGYQANFTVNTQALVSAGKMQSGCQDIRFANSSGSELSYWVESGCNTASTIIWVKVPSVPVAGISKLRMYYGNPSATSKSNGNTTFILFDDFNSLSKWNTVGSVSVSGGELILTNANAAAAMKTSFPMGAIIECKERVSVGQNARLCGWLETSTPALGNQMNWLQAQTGTLMYQHRLLNRGSISWPSYATTSIYRLDRVSSTNLPYIVDGITKYTETTSTYIDTGAGYPSFGTWTDGSTLNVDWMRVRNYTSSVPKISVGSERVKGTFGTTSVGVNKQSWIGVSALQTDNFGNLNITLQLFNRLNLMVGRSYALNVTTYEYNFTGLADGMYHANISASDGLGNIGRNTRDIVLDTAIGVSFITPTPKNGTWNTTQYFNVSIVEQNISTVNMSYSLVGGSKYNITYYDSTLKLHTSLDNNANIGETGTRVMDDSKSYRRGTMVASPNYKTGRYGNAMNFTKGVNYVNFTDSVGFTLASPFTVEAWIAPSDVADNWKAIMGTYSGSAGWIFAIGATSSNILNFYQGNAMYACTDSRCNMVENNQWRHVGVVVSGTQARFYVNGVNVYNTTMAAFTGDGGELQIGNGGSGWAIGSYGFAGRIDNAEIYSRALSSDEMKWEYYSNLDRYNKTLWYVQSKLWNDGNQTFTIRANDAVYNVNSASRQIVQNGYTPMVQYGSGTFTSGNYSRSSIKVNVTSSSTIFKNIRIYLYNNTGLLLTKTGNVTPFSYNFTGLGKGSYRFNATANDTLDRENATVYRKIYLDVDAPILTYVPPTPKNASFIQGNSPWVNVTTGENITNCVLNISYTSGTWWDKSYSSRQRINLTIASGATGGNYQQLFVFDTTNVGSGFNWTRACNDVRFVASDDTTALSYYIDKCDTTNKVMKVWVKVIASVTTSGTYMYMYYGNPSVSSIANGDNTFVLFDHFTTFDSAKWNVGGYSVSNS